MNTRLPTTSYFVFVKIFVAIFLLAFSSKGLMTSVIGGFLFGVLMHLATSYYDCVIRLRGTELTVLFIRPIFFKERIDLTAYNKVQIVRENKEHSMKELWWMIDSFIPLHYDKLVLEANGITRTLNFRTNQTDLAKLEAYISKKINSA